MQRLVMSGIDEVTFSIEGATPESYVKYRQRGSFDRAIATMRAAADQKRVAGRDVPFINWRYILFAHNDSDAEIDRALGANHYHRAIRPRALHPEVRPCLRRHRLVRSVRVADYGPTSSIPGPDRRSPVADD